MSPSAVNLGGQASEEVVLKACPFCGGEGAWVESEDDGYARAYCTCTAIGRLRKGEAEAIAAWNTRHPSGDTGEIVERSSLAFFESIAIYMQSLPDDFPGVQRREIDFYAEDVPEAHRDAVRQAMKAALAVAFEQQAATIAEVVEMVRLFPEAFDTLTRQEMRDAKGNWRSLIDQQTKALSKLRATLERTKQP
jgi:Lar family restriction alleviation protein